MARVGRHKEDYTLGAGRLYFAPLRSDGKYEGERYLGDAPALSLSIESEIQRLMSSDGPTAEQIASYPTQVTRTGTITLRDSSSENLAIFVGGDVSTVSQVATPVADESVGEGLALVGDRVYQLGVSASNPVGVRGVTAVSVKTTSPAKTYVLDTDYELDADAGHVRILPGGDLVGVAGVTASYTPTASTRWRVRAGDRVGHRGRLRFVADNSTGKNKDLIAPYAMLSPSGELAWKSRDSWWEIPIAIEFEKPLDGGAAIYIDGEPTL